MVDVMFVRTPVEKASEITVILRNLYLAGWRVVSHDENQGEYTFVLEGTVPTATVQSSKSGDGMGWQTTGF